MKKSGGKLKSTLGRGCGMIGDFSHIFWDCPKLQNFWGNVNREINVILNLNRPIEPQKLILGTVPLIDIRKNTVFLLRVLLLLKQCTTVILRVQYVKKKTQFYCDFFKQ
uniref:Reverse transcriptase zinc-binding domain-containing protein n=1 Tax=Salarias fasciatus TaxID=181472 RepID=A0A672HMQ7_SALFA